MDQSLLKSILQEYDEKRAKAISDAEDRKKALLAVNPHLEEIESELSKISLKTAKSVLLADGEEKAKLLDDLKKETNRLIKEKNAFLKSISKDSEYLNPHFECKMCKDTGFVNKDNSSTMCTCLKQKIFDVAYNKSNMGNLERENFSSFDLRRFSDKPNKELFKSDNSPRQNMEIIKEKCLSFIENFDDPNEKNLLFTGNTGTGKTFLSNCIASEMLKQGKTVLYQTAPLMLDTIIDAKFGKIDSNIYYNVLDVDLLIIDDLGTETQNEYKMEQIFNIINTRLLNQNHKITKTIISTNLSLESLFEFYSARIGSRIAGSYRVLRFYGDDLRIKKSLKDN